MNLSTTVIILAITSAGLGVVFAAALVYIIVKQARLMSRVMTELLAATMVADNPVHRAYVARTIAENIQDAPQPAVRRPVPVEKTPEGYTVIEGGSP